MRRRAFSRLQNAARRPVGPLRAVRWSLALHALLLLTVYAATPVVERAEFGGESKVLAIQLAPIAERAGEVSYQPPVPMETESWEEPSPRDPDVVQRPEMDSMPLERTAPQTDVVPRTDRELEERPLESSVPRVVYRKLEPEPDEPLIARHERRPLPRPSSTLEKIPGVDDELPPDFSNNAPPEYPLLAEQLRLEGEVLLRLRIGADGAVKEVSVLRSSGHDILDRAAVEAVRRWKGQPAMRRGKPVESVKRLPLGFRL